MPVPEEFPVGTLRCVVWFRNSENTLFDPSVVVTKYESSDGTITTKTYGSDNEVVKQDTGVYYIDVAVDLAGYWRFRWSGDGAPSETFILARSSVFV